MHVTVPVQMGIKVDLTMRRFVQVSEAVCASYSISNEECIHLQHEQRAIESKLYQHRGMSQLLCQGVSELYYQYAAHVTRYCTRVYIAVCKVR